MLSGEEHTGSKDENKEGYGIEHVSHSGGLCVRLLRGFDVYAGGLGACLAELRRARYCVDDR